MCSSLKSLDKLRNTTNKTTIMLLTSREVHFSAVLSKLRSINMFFREHSDNNQKPAVNKNKTMLKCHYRHQRVLNVTLEDPH